MDVAVYELRRVLFEEVIDLVEERVQLFADFLALALQRNLARASLSLAEGLADDVSRVCSFMVLVLP